MDKEIFYTREVAELLNIHKDTLLRWLRMGSIPEPKRNRNNWRVFTKQEVNNIFEYASMTVSKPEITATPYQEAISRLNRIDWNFTDANTGYLTHSIHPYPAKYIPQIPKNLIRELASSGDIVLDPFCGSGTTLVEALRLECNAIGIDANPLAALISRVKSYTLTSSQADILFQLSEDVLNGTDNIINLPLFKQIQNTSFDGIENWFDDFIIEELNNIKKLCLTISDKKTREIALCAFSSIIVSVSRQDSDTRYVRREKNLNPGNAYSQFSRTLKSITSKILELSNEVSSHNFVNVIEANVLSAPLNDKVDFVVCSPPYPNAFSYHLYHRTRMLWLGMDQPKFKKEEIGSHRKYSSKSKNAATVETFKAELNLILKWLSNILKSHRHACFIIGDSTIKGVRVKNDELLIEQAQRCGFSLEANISRRLQSTKKSFNPKVGKIKEEKIVILRNQN